jgi:hypothetical protein
MSDGDETNYYKWSDRAERIEQHVRAGTWDQRH